MNPKLNRTNYRSNESYLFHLYNDLGCKDLKVACSFRKDNKDIYWSKWFLFEDLQHKDRDDFVWKGYTRTKFLEKISHRSVLDIEVMLDIDEDEFGSSKKEDIEVLGNKICRKLNSKGFIYEVFFSGSKSYHISILFPQLRNQTKYGQEHFKKAFIKTHFGDKMKFHTNCMIALEGVEHWKTGIIKEEIKIE